MRWLTDTLANTARLKRNQSLEPAASHRQVLADVERQEEVELHRRLVDVQLKHLLDPADAVHHRVAVQPAGTSAVSTRLQSQIRNTFKVWTRSVSCSWS